MHQQRHLSYCGGALSAQRMRCELLLTQLWMGSIECPPRRVLGLVLHVTLDLWLTLLSMIMHRPSLSWEASCELQTCPVSTAWLSLFTLVPFALLVMGCVCMRGMRAPDCHYPASSPSTMPGL